MDQEGASGPPGDWRLACTSNALTFRVPWGPMAKMTIVPPVFAVRTDTDTTYRDCMRQRMGKGR